ncbi:MAG: insulinase family protein [Polyangiaceae bacterium]|nr:insulinase family protein [Polyangiaceae bacterium]
MSRLVFEASRELPLVSVSVSFAGGAVHEAPEQGGLARIVARMLRRGADGLGSDAIEIAVDELGGELGVDVGLGVTSIYFECLSRSVEPMSELVARLLARPTFAADELARLLRQTESEIVAARDDDGFLASRALRRQLFAGHPHGRRVGGSLACVRALVPDDARRFHARHYTRDNAIVAISGDLDGSGAERVAATLLGGLPAGEPVAYPVPEPTLPEGRRLVCVDKPERTQTQMVLGTLGSHPADEDHIALIAANTAFGGSMSSRLFQEVRGKRGWSYGASSSLGFARVREAFTMWTAPAVEDAADCLALELGLLRDFCREGVAQAELDHAQSYLRRSYAFEIDTARKRVGQAVGRALLGLPEDYHARYLERIAAVTREQANAAVRRRLSDDRLWVSVVATADESAAALAGAVPDLVETVVVPFDAE